ncbi:MAG: sensor histidine kinase, partial [bacterium]
NEKCRTANRELQKRIDDYKKKLKETILKNEEMLHRVKNHFSRVESWLRYQQSQVENEEGFRALEIAEARLHAFVSIQEQFNKTRQTEVVQSRDLLMNIIEHINTIFDEVSTSVDLTHRIDDVEIPSDTALKIGLALNELMTNAYQHVFIPGRGSSLTVDFSVRNDTCHLLVSDDGPGFPDDDQPRRELPKGLELVRELIEYESNGSLTLKEADRTTLEVRVPLETEKFNTDND